MKPTWYSKNKEKALAQAKAWKSANPERFRENVNRWKRENRAKVALHVKKGHWRRSGINLTHEEYNQLHDQQAGLCKICHKPCKSGRKLAVDHDHKTGVIRGLLCIGCNITLGHIEAYKNAPERWNNYLQAVDSIIIKPVDALFVPAPGWDYMIHGDYDHFCLARGIDPKKSWTEPTDEFFG